MRHLTRIGLTVVAFCGLMTMGTPAEALPVTESITFGEVIAVTDFTIPNSIDVATETAVVTCAQLALCDGSYVPLNGSVGNASFDSLPGGGYNVVWSVSAGGTAYAFNPLTITLNGILLKDTGLATITGFDNTAAAWSFSADQTGQLIAVPDLGQTGMLLGMAVVGLAMVRRRISGEV